MKHLIKTHNKKKERLNILLSMAKRNNPKIKVIWGPTSYKKKKDRKITNKYPYLPTSRTL